MMATEEHLEWDRSHDWELVRHTQNQFDVTVLFSGPTAAVAELVALRTCIAQFRHMPPAKLRQLVGKTKEFKLGTYTALEYVELQRDAEHAGLTLIATETSFTTIHAD